MSGFLLFLILALTVHRVSRLFWLDDIFKEPRVALKGWLQIGHVPDDIVGTPKMEDWLNEYHNTHPRRELFRRKTYDLIECGWCISAWVAGFLVLGMHLFTDVSMPLPLLWWPALSSAAVIGLEYTDGEKHVVLKQPKEKK